METHCRAGDPQSKKMEWCEEVATNQGMEGPLESEKGKDMDSPLDALKGTQPCQQLDVRLQTSRKVW